MCLSLSLTLSMFNRISSYLISHIALSHYIFFIVHFIYLLLLLLLSISSLSPLQPSNMNYNKETVNEREMKVRDDSRSYCVLSLIAFSHSPHTHTTSFFIHRILDWQDIFQKVIMLAHFALFHRSLHSLFIHNVIPHITTTIMR